MATQVKSTPERQTVNEELATITPEFSSTYYATPIRIAHLRALHRYNAERNAIREE